MKRKKQKMGLALVAMFLFCITACSKSVETDHEKEHEFAEEYVHKNDIKKEEAGKGIKERESPEEKEIGTGGSEQSEADYVFTTYLTEEIQYGGTVLPVQFSDDLSLIEDMKYRDSIYAYQEGRVYYRRYHEDSFEETALWGNYDFIPETQTEIVCIEPNGKETVLFADEGYGKIYLLHDRFYMTDARVYEEDGALCRDRRLYSVDMQGNDRIDYGNGEILVIDRERKIMILEMWERETFQSFYRVMNYETGEMKSLNLNSTDDELVQIKYYQDGWLYYEKYKRGDAVVSRLCAVSLEGEQKEIFALTSDRNRNARGYLETILRTEVDGDRIYFIFGGYDGSAVEFQGGMLISVRSDGTDYKAVSVGGEAFYLFHEDGKTFIYFEPPYLETEDPDHIYDIWVWDVEGDRCYPADLSRDILYAYYNEMDPVRWYSGNKETLCKTTYDESREESINVYAVPDDSGKIVRAAMDLEEHIPKRENEEAELVQYENLYYADGFLYFTVEYSAYDQESSIGWRDGYRRLRSDVYRLKTGESDYLQIKKEESGDE